jgi:uncharacterized membrane protein YhiD involved in acid resistance
MPEFLKKSLGTATVADVPHLWELFARMALASILGAFVAYRFWRRFMRHQPPPSLLGAQSQTLIAAAGALMVVVIGDNVARAFGLVGLGSFIRFRSGISDPRDAAVMFVMIGIGMACGLGLPLMAIAGTVFVCVMLVVFDATSRRRSIVTITADDPSAAWVLVARAFPGARAIEVSSNRPELGKDNSRLVVEIDLPATMDAAALRRVLDAEGVSGLVRVALSLESTS